MRTTITLDDDVAVRLERLRGPERTFRELVNDALRRGLDAIERPSPRRRKSYTTPADVGLLVPNIDDVWGVIAAVEGDDHR
jgi:Arc/MetJ family transcription regulator